MSKAGAIKQEMVSQKLATEEASKKNRPEMNIPVYQRDEVIKIAPIVTHNEWVIVIPFMIDSTVLLPKDSDHKNAGIIVGRSESILAPNGAYVTSHLKIGQTVLFHKRAVVGIVPLNCEPYINKRLCVISQRNIVCDLEQVPFEIVGGPITHAAVLEDED